MGAMTASARPYRGVSAVERRATRRAALLEAALDLLGGPEPRPVTMTAVCERAGLTERYFYESFTDRDALLVELLDQISSEIADRANAALDGAEGPPGHRVRVAMTAVVDLFAHDPRKGRVALVESVGLPILRARRQELLAAFEALFVVRSVELYGEDALPEQEARLTSVLFVGGLVELIASWLSGAVETDPEQLVDIVTRTYVSLAHR